MSVDLKGSRRNADLGKMEEEGGCKGETMGGGGVLDQVKVWEKGQTEGGRYRRKEREGERNEPGKDVKEWIQTRGREKARDDEG